MALLYHLLLPPSSSHHLAGPLPVVSFSCNFSLADYLLFLPYQYVLGAALFAVVALSDEAEADDAVEPDP